MDILRNNETYLFGRLGKEKDASTAGIRDMETGRYNSILENDSSESKVFEASTYFLLDYKSYIVSYITGQSAPGINCLSSMVNNYTESGNFLMHSIVDPENIKSLLKDGSKISRIKCSFAKPSDEILHYIGLTDKQVLDLNGSDTCGVEVIIKGNPRGSIVNNLEKMADLINTFETVKNEGLLKAISFFGKEPNQNSKLYTFDESSVQYTINISETKRKKGITVLRTPKEIADDVYEKLVIKYQEQREDLLFFAGLR